MQGVPYDEVKKFTDKVDGVVALVLVALSLSAAFSTFTALSFVHAIVALVISLFLGAVAIDMIIGMVKSN